MPIAPARARGVRALAPQCAANDRGGDEDRSVEYANDERAVRATMAVSGVVDLTRVQA
jgi:hypothetical protein